LRTQLAKAQDRGDAKTQKRLINEFNQLTDNISGVSSVGDLDNEQSRLSGLADRLEQEKEQHEDSLREAKSNYQNTKSGLRERKRREIEALEDAKENLDNELMMAERSLDQIIDVGQERGEQFTETMLTQQSILNDMESRIRDTFGLDPQRRGTIRETTESRGNMQFGLGRVSEIEDDDRQERMIADIASLDNR